jgi:hypothetical protein
MIESYTYSQTFSFAKQDETLSVYRILQGMAMLGGLVSADFNPKLGTLYFLR